MEENHNHRFPSFVQPYHMLTLQKTVEDLTSNLALMWNLLVGKSKVFHSQKSHPYFFQLSMSYFSLFFFSSSPCFLFCCPLWEYWDVHYWLSLHFSFANIHVCLEICQHDELVFFCSCIKSNHLTSAGKHSLWADHAWNAGNVLATKVLDMHPSIVEGKTWGRLSLSIGFFFILWNDIYDIGDYSCFMNNLKYILI